MNIKPFAPLLCVLALAACSGKPPAPQTQPAGATTTARVATPWDGMEKDKQRARDVQKVIDQQAAQQQQQTEAASQ